MPIPVATRSKAWFCGRSVAGMASSNLAGSMVVCCERCVLSGWRLRWADHSPRAVLPSVVCLSVIVKPRWGSPDSLRAVAPREKYLFTFYLTFRPYEKDLSCNKHIADTRTIMIVDWMDAYWETSRRFWYSVLFCFRNGFFVSWQTLRISVCTLLLN
jgi:hypothetical protein